MSKKVAVFYSRDALKFLKKVDTVAAKRIVNKIKTNARQPNPLHRAKPLQGDLLGKYRYRIGAYRAVFIINDNEAVVILSILKISHRKDVYKSKG